MGVSPVQPGGDARLSIGNEGDAWRRVPFFPRPKC